MPSRSPSPPPRRYLPQPVTQEKGGNRRAKDGPTGKPDEAKPADRMLPQPVESSARSSRRTSKTTDVSNAELRDSASIPPQPMESTQTSSKSRRFAPQMVETSRRSRRNTDETVGMEDADRTDSSAAADPQSGRRSRRKRPELAPQPPGNTPICSSAEVPQVPPESRFSASKIAEKQQRRHSFRIPDLPSIKSSSGTEDDENASDALSLGRTTSAESDSGPRGGSRRRKRTYPIATRESEDERFSGYLLTLAATAAEKQLREQAMAAYPNENIHEPVDHYAADRDEPYSDAEGHVSPADSQGHGEDGQHTITSGRKEKQRHRDSDAGWDLADMRKHQSELESQRQRAWLSGDAGTPRDAQPEIDTRHKSQQPPENVPSAPQPPKEILGYQKDDESAAMRRAAAPPMAGKDLRFSKCMSPRQTRLDVHQYPGGRRKSTAPPTRQHTGLWTPRQPTGVFAPSREPSRMASKGERSGLWMGVNAASAQQGWNLSRESNTGLMTPARERSDPFSTMGSSKPSSRRGSPSRSARKAGLAMTSVISSPVSEQPPKGFPPTPPASIPPDSQTKHTTAPSITASGSAPTQEDLEREFPDSFITQVYNYLSLGYPVVARPYDEELSRITHCPIETLAYDDKDAAAGTSPPATGAASKEKERNLAPYARGYVGVPEGTGADARGAADEAGERWKALRLYVWEWGRQQKGIWEGDSSSGEGEESEEEEASGTASARGARGDVRRRETQSREGGGGQLEQKREGLYVPGGYGTGRKTSWGW